MPVEDPSNIKLSSEFISCLSIEKQEDIDQTADLISACSPKVLSSNGLAILNLVVSNVRTGIGGKTIAELNIHSSIDKSSSGIEVGDFRVGDIVKLDKQSSESNNSKKLKNSSKNSDKEEAEEEEVIINGVITSVSEKQISISVQCDSNTQQGSQIELKLYNLYDSDSKVWIVKINNAITYNRMESTMRKLAEMKPESFTEIIRLVLGESKFIEPSSTTQEKLDWFNDNLNESQKEAIRFSLSSNLSIIHGPPGTGKTSTVVELVKQLVIQKRLTQNTKKILICGPSNISVDTILERLAPFYSTNTYSKLVRIGHPARILPSILRHSLDLITESESGEILKDILAEINTLSKKTKKTKSYRERKEIYSQIKLLRKDLRVRSIKATTSTILNAEVVVATLHGSSSRELMQCINHQGDQFDTLIIDEVSQSLEPACWIPLIHHQSIKKLLIAGDNKQLSPTIKTKSNQRVITQLSKTLFDRLIETHSNHAKFTNFLNVQYRMNDKIMRFPSDSLYDGRLTSDKSVADRKVIDLPNVSTKSDDTLEEIIWYDTQGDEYPEQDTSLEDDGKGDLASSRFNDGECLLVLKHVKSLLEAGVTQHQIGVISPYSAQVGKLRKLLRDGLLNDERFSNEIELTNSIEISTVDGFQGREKEIIILSLVRSNPDHDVGFLSDFKRLNVSITRSQKQLCVVGNMETLAESNVPFLKNWCDWCEENADIRYVDINDLY
ncbi:hypothetical protein CANARDRAFT_198961 [[Candida] arabinofermentans NRRL YB-2248]|uniref:DNA helicase n=1 Tax=[Candida] arabinofermentans NRRL YB-2248 TaxID=983967 RepID=A0A1E4T179_9ASCO|nr:hypothetical protein CANARDRAFT_198961 [[Candida] arabinofermentans NRRL YB-2248]